MTSRINKNHAILIALFTFVFAFVLINTTNAAAQSISGRVTAEDTGKGLEDIMIDLQLEDGGHHPIIKTNKDGFYVITDLRPGTYYIGFGHEDHSSFPYIVEKLQKIVLPEGKKSVKVDHDFKLGGSVSGAVYQADGITPVVGLMVRASFADQPEEIRGSKVEHTDSNGNFLLSGLPASNKCRIKFNVYGRAPMIKTISVIKGEITSDVNFVITMDDITGISGYVKSSIDGRPLENAEVVLLSPDYKGKFIASSITDANGKYSIVAVQPGTKYVATAFDPKSEFDYISRTDILIKPGKSTEVNFEFAMPTPSSP